MKRKASARTVAISLEGGTGTGPRLAEPAEEPSIQVSVSSGTTWRKRWQVELSDVFWVAGTAQRDRLVLRTILS